MRSLITIDHLGSITTMEAPNLWGLAATLPWFMSPRLHRFYKESLPIVPLVILDIGASFGAMTMFYHNTYPEAEIHSVEASSASFEYLERNLRPLPSATPYKFAASNVDGEVRIALPADEQRDCMKPARLVHGEANPGHVSVYGASNSLAEIVPAYALDSKFERAGLIKIDVEGYTLPVLKGATRIIEQSRPILQIESALDSYAMADYSVDDLWQWLRDREYALFKEIDAMGDLIFVPKERLA